MENLISFFSPRLIQALGWTLLHSLWQGVLVAFIVAATMILMNRMSANIRYFIAVSAMFCLLAASAFTFCNIYNSSKNDEGVTIATIKPAMGIPYSPQTSLKPIRTFVNNKHSNWDGADIQDYFSRHLPAIVLLWMIGIVVLSLKLLGSLAYVQRLKGYKTFAMAPEWQRKVDGLCEKLNINKKVTILESALIKVPVAIGYFKPIILLPLGTALGLPAPEIEMILAHELAHISRNDYWVNIGQSIVEILFFYHPAVWWVSKVVRQEREHCCDDKVLQLNGDSFVFAQALANLQFIQQANPALVMAANGQKGSLLGRIKRILNEVPKKPTFNEGLIASIVVLLCFLAISASAFTSFSINNNVFSSNDSLTIRGENLLLQADDTSKNRVVREIIIVKNKKGKVKEVLVDNKKLSNEELKDYKISIEKRLDEIEKEQVEAPEKLEKPEVPEVLEVTEAPEISMDRIIVHPLPPVMPTPPFKPGMFIAHNGELEELSVKIGQISHKMVEIEMDDKLSDDEKNKLHKKLIEEQAVLSNIISKLALEQEKVARKEYLQTLKQYKEKDLEQYKADMKMYEEELKEYQRDHKDLQLKQGEFKEFADKLRDNSDYSKHKKITLYYPDRKKTIEKEHQVDSDVLRQELQKDKFINKGEPFSFEISRKNLWINGKKQSVEVFEKYKQLMKKKTNIDVERFENDDNSFHINVN